MLHASRFAAAPLALAVFLALPVHAESDRDQPIFDMRYRFEHVDPDNALRNADAQTLRTRIGYRSARVAGWSGLVEVDNVSHLGAERFNSTRNGRTAYAAVPDPDGTGFNQALLRFDSDAAAAILGRQRINLDNQRFIGGVGWRQNEQTFDAASLQFKPADKLAFWYSYVDDVDSVFGPDDRHANATNPADYEGRSHLLNVQAKLFPALAFTAYQYRLELDNVAVTANAPLGTLSSITTGLRASGRAGAWSYAVEFARQKDNDGNPWHLDSRYALAELGHAIDEVQLRAGYEKLGAGRGTGNGNRAFQTPLGTRHAFQGWADQFLTTPAGGIEDRYIGVTAPLWGGSVQACLHDFIADRGGADYGSELDVSYQHRLPWSPRLTVLGKLARYRSDDVAFTVDTDKAWLQLQYSH